MVGAEERACVSVRIQLCRGESLRLCEDPAVQDLEDISSGNRFKSQAWSLLSFSSDPLFSRGIGSTLGALP